MIRRVTIFFLFLIFFFPQISNAEKVWQRQNAGLGDIDVRSISVFSGDDRFICVACAHSVYFSENGGDFWKETFSLKGEGDEINFVTFDSSSPEIVYLATTKGLFATKNKGQDWLWIFRRVAEQANNVSWVSLDPLDNQRIYVGTEGGLYLSSDSGTTWSKANGGLPHSSIMAMAVHPSNSYVLYLANTYGLFKSIDKGCAWERTYVSSPRITDDEDAEDDEESSQTNKNQGLISCIAIDKYNPKKVFIATGKGIFVSSDSGESWNKLPGQGLSYNDVNFIVVSSDPPATDKEGWAGKESVVYAATKNGVFEFLPGLDSWQEIYQGMTARDVRGLALNTDGKQLFAATDRGVFKTIEIKNAQKQRQQRQQEEKVEIDKDNEIDFKQLLKGLSLNEPTIREVQEAALRYAEVIHPQRIKTLRRNAKLKALLPDVSLDYDKTIYGTAGSSSSDPRAFVGPYDWGLSLSWDVGDLVFSEQIRLLDSNARLMVQLRDNIMNEITRLYYERRKLQTEVMMTPPKNPQENIIKRLRLEELTANIDGLTGGYFSRHLKTKFFLD